MMACDCNHECKDRGDNTQVSASDFSLSLMYFTNPNMDTPVSSVKYITKVPHRIIMLFCLGFTSSFWSLIQSGSTSIAKNKLTTTRTSGSSVFVPDPAILRLI